MCCNEVSCVTGFLLGGKTLSLKKEVKQGRRASKHGEVEECECAAEDCSSGVEMFVLNVELNRGRANTASFFCLSSL